MAAAATTVLVFFAFLAVATCNASAPCSVADVTVLRNKCLMTFLLEHAESLPKMKTAPVCPKHLIQCPKVRNVVNCLNSIPDADISRGCRPGFIQTIDAMLDVIGIKCKYADIAAKCWQPGFPVLKGQEHLMAQAQVPGGSAGQSGPVMNFPA